MICSNISNGLCKPRQLRCSCLEGNKDGVKKPVHDRFTRQLKRLPERCYETGVL